MDFEIKNIKENIVEVARQIGYLIIDTKENGEYNLVRRLGADNYPRFHIYLKSFGAAQDKLNYEFSLHLDQKQPSYESKGAHAHNGEYFGPVLNEEVGRIKQIFTQ